MGPHLDHPAMLDLLERYPSPAHLASISQKSWRLDCSNLHHEWGRLGPRRSSRRLVATEYKTSKELFEQLGRVLKAVEPVYGKDTVTRLGLRYVDAIVSRKNESIFDYVAPGMAGISFDANLDKRVQCVVEQHRANGGLAVRLLALNIPMYASPDLPQPQVELSTNVGYGFLKGWLRFHDVFRDSLGAARHKLVPQEPTP